MQFDLFRRIMLFLLVVNIKQPNAIIKESFIVNIIISFIINMILVMNSLLNDQQIKLEINKNNSAIKIFDFYNKTYSMLGTIIFYKDSWR